MLGMTRDGSVCFCPTQGGEAAWEAEALPFLYASDSIANLGCRSRPIVSQ